jgi:hemoglobin-like flavoprotein
MSPEQKALVKESWRKVAPMADAAARLFYDRLFEIDSTTRPLFQIDLADQRRKLIQALTMVVQGLDHLETLVPTIADLGRRHAQFGVTDAHYDTVGAALLWTLEQGLGSAWTPEVKVAWSCAYALLADVMREAADEPAFRACSFHSKSRAHLNSMPARPSNSPDSFARSSRVRAETNAVFLMRPRWQRQFASFCYWPIATYAPRCQFGR